MASKTRAPSYLKQRGLGWYVQLAVPREHQAAVGQKVLLRSLQTRDRVEANRRKHAAIAELQALIASAVARAPNPSLSDTPEGLLELATRAREGIEAGTEDPDQAEAGFDAAVEDFLDDQAAHLGRDDEGNPRLPPEALSKVRRGYKVLSGSLSRTLAKRTEAYLEESAGHLTAQTVDEKRRHLAAFLDWFGSDREPLEVSRKVAGTYVADVVQKRTRKGPDGAPVPLSASARQKEVGTLRTFFAWLSARGSIDANPFDRLTVRESGRGKAPRRRPWSSEELGTVLHGIAPNDPVWALTVLGAYTGMRREEVGELEVSNIDGDGLRITQGKTPAAIRRVPIHPAIAPLVAQLAATSTDGFLIPGLLRGGPDSKRSWYVGKRFGRVIRQLGVTDRALDFHALRGTVITQMEGAGVPESTIQLIVGHKRQGMTFGVYSAGVGDDAKREAVRAVSYGRALDSFVRKVGRKVVVRPSAKARGSK
ncbi:DUF6538 domain-containing protein [Lysobacter sp. F60174L2]|uniref:DUF6538 domain-containing protein n=1 Tax=Lysobacter sp. F60174L2 TaxID=3459295 RepID=UPI00403DEEB6